MRYYNFQALMVAVLVCCLVSSWSFEQAVVSLGEDTRREEDGEKVLIDGVVK